MTTSTATWLAADPALPQRDALLDTDVVAERIGRLFCATGRVTVERCERLRVNYQIGKSLRVLHRVDAAGATWTIAARAGRGAREPIAPLASRAGMRPAFHDADLNTTYWVFPNDRKIAGLPAVACATVAVNDPALLAWTSSRPVAYAPEKSATLACLDSAGAPVAYARVCAEPADCSYRIYRALYESLAGGDAHVRVPRPIAYLPSHHTLFLEAIAGRRLADSAGEHAHLPADARRLGAALAAFHGLRAGPAPPFARFAPDRLVGAARLVSHVRPDVERQATELARKLATRAGDAAGEPVTLHGDVHPKNAIVTGAGIALVDAEDVAIGPAAADVGSVLAAFAYLQCGGQLNAADHDAVAGAFLDEYAAVRPLPGAAALRWHSAAALFLERAVRAVTRIRPLGLCYLAELLTEADAMLTASGNDRDSLRGL